MSNLFKWQKGRQGSGYDKMLLAINNFLLPFDCYLIKYPVGSFIPKHTDPVDKSKRHYRLNVVVKPSSGGGDFVCKNCIINTKYIKFFRPDLNEHEVTEIKGSARYVFSLGFLLNNKKVWLLILNYVTIILNINWIFYEKYIYF